MHDHVAAEDHGACDRNSAQHFHQRHGQDREARDGIAALLQAVDGVAHLLALLVLERVGLDHADIVDGLLEDRGGQADILDFGFRVLLDAAHEVAHHEHGRRADQERKERHLRALQDHHADQRNQREEIAPERHRHHVDDVARGGGVVPLAAHDAARLGRLEIIQPLAQQAFVIADLELGDDALAEPRHDQRVDIAGPALDDENRKHHACDEIDRGLVALDEDRVDDILHQIRHRGRGQRDDADQRKRGGIARPFLCRALHQEALHEAHGAFVHADLQMLRPGHMRCLRLLCRCPRCRGFWPSDCHAGPVQASAKCAHVSEGAGNARGSASGAGQACSRPDRPVSAVKARKRSGRRRFKHRLRPAGNSRENG